MLIIDIKYQSLKTGSVDPTWRKATAPLSASHPYQVIIQALIGSSSIGSIAMDDVLISEQACPREGKFGFVP